DIVWRSRSVQTLPLLRKAILDPQTSSDERPRYFRAFDFIRPQNDQQRQIKQAVLLSLATAQHPDRDQIASLALHHLGRVDLNDSPQMKEIVDRALDDAKGTSRFVQLVAQFRIGDRYPELLKLAQA